MPQRIVIGNLISLSGAAFLISSAITENKRRLYLYGFFECILLFIAQLFFGQGAAAVSLLIAAFRNFLIYIGKYTKYKLILVFIASLVFGLVFNTGGILGLVPLFASLIFTVTSYYAKSYIKVKLSFLFNLFLWTVYSALIFDLASTVINFFSLIATVISVLKYYKNKKESEKYTSLN